MTGERFSVSPGFLLLLAFLFYLDEGTGLLGWGLLACALHELGHVAAIRLLGGRFKSLKLTAAGAELALDPNRSLSYGRELLSALAGPLTNLVLAWMAARRGAFLLSGLSMGLGLFNLLPILPLDGGRCLHCGLSLWVGTLWADRVLRITSAMAVGLMLGVGAVLLRQLGNVTLLITALWLLSGQFSGFLGEIKGKKTCIF